MRSVRTDDLAMQAEIVDDESEHIVLMGALSDRGAVPGATVSYTVDGVSRATAAPVASDPVLGRPLSLAEEWFGADPVLRHRREDRPALTQ